MDEEWVTILDWKSLAIAHARVIQRSLKKELQAARKTKEKRQK